MSSGARTCKRALKSMSNETALRGMESLTNSSHSNIILWNDNLEVKHGMDCLLILWVRMGEQEGKAKVLPEMQAETGQPL